MDKKNLYVRNGQNVFRVASVYNLRAEIIELHQDYWYSMPERSELGDTGLLTIFRIAQKDESLISFAGRWDQNKQVLDVDILGVSREILTHFKSEKSGYSGHHPKRISETERTFDIHIRVPEETIFRGTITFNVGHGHAPGLFGQ